MGAANVNVLEIRSATNARVKDLVRLQKQSGERRAAGLFCLETERELSRALDAGYEVAAFWDAGGRDGNSEAAQRAMAAAGNRIVTTPDVLKKIAYRDEVPPFVAVMRAKQTTLEGIELPRKPLILVCSGLEKPGNLGAIFRSADAAGADAVLIDDPKVDLYNPNCVRASTGAVFSLPIAAGTSEQLRGWLKDKQVPIVAATPEADLTYLQLNMRPGVALVLGAEAEGLSENWRSAADLAVSIPMRGRSADSLNVSVTAAIFLFEARRQRS
jgi:TrmH family RNA methyltransferase